MAKEHKLETLILEILKLKKEAMKIVKPVALSGIAHEKCPKKRPRNAPEIFKYRLKFEL